MTMRLGSARPLSRNGWKSKSVETMAMSPDKDGGSAHATTARPALASSSAATTGRSARARRGLGRRSRTRFWCMGLARRLPPPQLPPVLHRTAHLADGLVDAIGGAGLAGLYADAFAVPARRHRFRGPGAGVLRGAVRRHHRRPRRQAPHAGDHAGSVHGAGGDPRGADADACRGGVARDRAGAVHGPDQRLRRADAPGLHHRDGGAQGSAQTPSRSIR